jgi:hypothetical protein
VQREERRKLLYPFEKCAAVLDESLREWSKRFTMMQTSGSNSVVECDLAKVEVAGSNPVSRSRFLLPAGSFPPDGLFPAGTLTY